MGPKFCVKLVPIVEISLHFGTGSEMNQKIKSDDRETLNKNIIYKI